MTTTPKHPQNCPKGHVTEWGQYDIPTCKQCDLIATSYNGRTGEVHQWTPRHEHEDACQRLQDEMDAAFDNQYFSEW